MERVAPIPGTDYWVWWCFSLGLIVSICCSWVLGIRILGLEGTFNEGWENYSLLAKPSLPPVVVSAVCWSPATPMCLRIVRGLHITSRIEYCHRDCKASLTLADNRNSFASFLEWLYFCCLRKLFAQLAKNCRDEDCAVSLYSNS